MLGVRKTKKIITQVSVFEYCTLLICNQVKQGKLPMMDPEHKQRLQRLWSKLIENITDIDGIVDGLYSAQVFTKSMKERVNEKTGTNRLREVLDILPRRGDKAFLAFYDVLVKCREYEAAQLLCPEKAAELSKVMKQVASASQEMGSLPTGLEEDDLPAKWPDLNHDPSAVDVVRVSDDDNTMKRRYHKAALGDGLCYSMSKAPRGLCLIINNRNFKAARETGKKLQDRDGTEMDGSALLQLFTQLGFEVVDNGGCQDLTAQSILAAVKDVGQLDHTYYDCFVCVVLSHGERDVLYGVDGQTVPIQELTNAVDGSSSPTLVGKPKLFFIQACQGEKKDGVILADKDTVSNQLSSLSVSDRDHQSTKMAEIYIGDYTTTDSVSEAKVASKLDIFVASATVPDFVSWRNTRRGTWFIQAIVYIFSRQAHIKSLLEMMTNVNLLVSRAETSHGCKQVSVFTSTLKWPLYFFPGLVIGSPSPQRMYTIQQNLDVSVENKVEKAQGKRALVDSGVELMQTASLQPLEPSVPVQAEDSTCHSTGSALPDTMTPAQVAECNVQSARSTHADKGDVVLERPAQTDQCNIDSSSSSEGEDLSVEKLSVNLARPAGVVTQASEEAGGSKMVW